MSLEKSSVLENFFYHWIQSFPYGNEQKKNVFCFEMEDKIGYVSFVGNGLVELQAVSKENKDQYLFYLHFEIRNVKDTSHYLKTFFDFLWNETNQSLNHKTELIVEDTKVKNILFVCSAGWSSAYFAEEIERELQARHLDIQTAATPVENLLSVIDDYDVVFFAPQIAYIMDDYKEEYGNKIHKISSYDFGTWNFTHIIQQALCA